MPVHHYTYPPPNFDRSISRYVGNFADRAERGAAVANAAEKLRAKGYVPDVVFGHFGWGETLYLKNVWPASKLAIYAEFFYHPRGLDADFDPELQRPNLTTNIVTTTLQAHLLLAMHTRRCGDRADALAGADLSGPLPRAHRGHSRRHRHGAPAARSGRPDHRR